MASGRALVRNPKVFLFNEPLSNLDAALRVQMRLELASLRDSLQATMIYVTHDQVEAMTLADKIVVLQGGIVEQVGSPLDLYHHSRNLFVAGFIGSPRMNFMSVTVSGVNDSGTTVRLLGDASVTIPVKPSNLSVGDRATLGVRSEHLRLDQTNVTLTGEVMVSEQLGGAAHLYIKLVDGDTIIVQTDGDNRSQLHDYVPIHINRDLCHLDALRQNGTGQLLKSYCCCLVPLFEGTG